MRQHADDLAGGFRLGFADRGRDGLMILLCKMHHQPPEAPPPPDEPPPPEKPPPKPPPQPGPPGMKIGPIPRRRTPLPGPPPPAFRIRYQQIKTISRKNRIGNSLSKSAEGSSLRTSTFGCQSDVSPDSTLIMPSTPRLMPPEKSPALKRGTMALEMMTDDRASVSVPSRP